MCLFFGNGSEECQHAECQIVNTIKQLNSQSLFGHGGQSERRPSLNPSIHPSPAAAEESRVGILKVEPEGGEWNVARREETDRERITRLEKEMG